MSLEQEQPPEIDIGHTKDFAWGSLLVSHAISETYGLLPAGKALPIKVPRGILPLRVTLTTDQEIDMPGNNVLNTVFKTYTTPDGIHSYFPFPTDSDPLTNDLLEDWRDNCGRLEGECSSIDEEVTEEYVTRFAAGQQLVHVMGELLNLHLIAAYSPAFNRIEAKKASRLVRLANYVTVAGGLLTGAAIFTPDIPPPTAARCFTLMAAGILSTTLATAHLPHSLAKAKNALGGRSAAYAESIGIDIHNALCFTHATINLDDAPGGSTLEDI